MLFDLFDLDGDGILDALEMGLADELLLQEQEQRQKMSPPKKAPLRPAAPCSPPDSKPPTPIRLLPSYGKKQGALPSLTAMRRAFPRKK